MTYRLVGIASLVLALGACSASENQETADSLTSADKPNASSTARTGLDRNACELLTEAEVSAAVGAPVKAQETNRETGRSDCAWVTADSLAMMTLVGYWSGGKEGWEILGMSRSMAKGIIQKQEGVALDSVVKSGPVEGLGDKAFFSPLLPSLVLEDNVLLEFSLALLPNPAASFYPLATKALSRL